MRSVSGLPGRTTPHRTDRTERLGGGWTASHAPAETPQAGRVQRRGTF